MLFLHFIWLRSPRSTRPKYLLGIFGELLVYYKKKIWFWLCFVVFCHLRCFVALWGVKHFPSNIVCAKKNMKFRKSGAPPHDMCTGSEMCTTMFWQETIYWTFLLQIVHCHMTILIVWQKNFENSYILLSKIIHHSKINPS